MRPVYMICHRDRQHVTLFTAAELDETARCLAAQPNRDELLVYASDGGFSREFTDGERSSLDAHLRATGA